VGIDSDSKAAESGLKVHDIIKEVNHQGITSVKDLDKAISNVEKGETVNLFIRRMNRGFLVIKITK
jgi:S1-C subfamily serine protease